MATLSVSVPQILAALLNRTKIQTIRPAWKDKCVVKDAINGVTFTENTLKRKPPRYKIRQKVKVFWKQRSPHKLFCRNCGEVHINEQLPCNSCGMITRNFHKKRGEITITKIFEIEMGHDYVNCNQPIVVDTLAQDDGFTSSKEMFALFNMMYDLSQAKPFYVYQWKWCQNGN